MKKNIGITIGDPAGIGPEIVLKALCNHPQIFESCNPLIFGHAKILQLHARLLKMDIDIQITDMDFPANNLNPGTLYCSEPEERAALAQPGSLDGANGRLSFSYIEQSIKAAKRKKISAIATAPINKQALKLGKVPYLDHTEIFTKLTDSTHTMTLFETGTLRTFFLTRHLPFKEISTHLHQNEIETAIEYSLSYLKQLGIGRPHLAVAALNPHGGESGLFGDEEINIIVPAVKAAQSRGLHVSGPIPADSVYHLTREGHYDAVLSLYHDQGHIATKTLDFYRTVSLTMGLPFLRTSVDHGTAMEIAGQNKANEISMVEAILAAAKYGW